MSDTGKMRQTLVQWLLTNRHPEPDDVLVDELCFLNKRNRADLVHANGALSAFEIKSANDSLARWPSQMAAYLLVFDEIWLCVHGKHVAKALQASDKSVGMLVMDDMGGVAMVRPAVHNTKVNAYHLSGLLWRAEIDDLITELGLTRKRSERIDDARIRLASSAPLRAIQAKVLGSLKARYPRHRPYSSSLSSSGSVEIAAGKSAAIS